MTPIREKIQSENKKPTTNFAICWLCYYYKRIACTVHYFPIVPLFCILPKTIIWPLITVRRSCKNFSSIPYRDMVLLLNSSVCIKSWLFILIEFVNLSIEICVGSMVSDGAQSIWKHISKNSCEHCTDFHFKLELQ